MADNAIITVNDGATVPVEHSFEPSGIYGDVAKYQNKAASAFVGRETLQLKMKHSAKVRTVGINLRVPRTITETVNGVSVESMVDYASGNAELIVPVTWTAAQAKDVEHLLSNIITSALVALMVQDGEFVW
jgi:hypothetical protein